MPTLVELGPREGGVFSTTLTSIEDHYISVTEVFPSTAQRGSSTKRDIMYSDSGGLYAFTLTKIKSIKTTNTKLRRRWGVGRVRGNGGEGGNT